MITTITDHGAVGDGITNDAAAIQAAIDAVTAAGGGRVIVPAGKTYLTGSILLKDNVELHLEPGAVLDGSSRVEDYTERFTTSALSGGEITDKSQAALILISAHNASNVSITGAGEVRGGGRHFINLEDRYIHRCPNQRPYTLFFRGCSRVTLRDTLFTDAGLWCLRFSGVDDLLVHGVRIDADLRYPNADGIDLDRCKRVRISDCWISCGDDAISLKTCEEFPEYGPCEDVVITNCVLRSTSSAVVVGVDAVDDINNVVVSNCVIRESHRGLSVNLGQEGNFNNILFSDCIVETRFFSTDWWGRGEPIYVTAYPWHDQVGKIRNVRFRNILCRSENGVYISGLTADLVAGVVLDGVRVELDRWSSWPGGEYDRRPFDSGELIYASPTSGIHIDKATDVTIRNCEIVWARENEHFAHALSAQAVNGLTIDGLLGSAARPDLEAISVHP